ncbi:hypothetical protein BU25DRAFT_479648 [Macroventuria anomochaeta]|uniref:Uncharacterized protein n=1 Tax=Macroventuria anomochaeta TaxID=301207 RepID=A0ACB6RM93_9PLEO|nr:uncharacterized protein BU25DRAFT_479648 [Macroventuria anomochaeta]KAF2623055.1 hypothetical protein BU25DRAFT_479648 [Macroventuria anomochaeta]
MHNGLVINHTPDRITACAEFQRIITQPPQFGLIAWLGAPDARAVHTHEMEHLLDVLADIFFPSKIRFKIVFPPANNQASIHSAVSEAALEWLGTLLHELFHAFVELYACQQCTWDEDAENLNGRGRVWRRVATQIELVCQRTLSLKVGLERFDAIRGEWGVMKYWRGVEEVMEWKLVDK